MLALLFATLLGYMALGAQGYQLPPEFVQGAQERGAPVVMPADGGGLWLGIEWRCSLDVGDDETCWSGATIDTSGVWLETGP